MKFRIIEDQRETFPIRVLCDVMGVSAAGYYAWRGRPESPRKTANRALLTEIRSLHLAHRGRYGAPRIHAALRDLGHTASRGRIERLMRHHGIRAITARRFRTCTTDSRHDWPIAPNRLNQNFAADRPNQVWLADITYVPTSEGWLYLAVVLDLFTRKIVGWAMRDHMRAELTIAALTMAIQRQKPPPGLIDHSDRGSQYAATDYRKVLDGAAMIQSMSRKGNCWDNAPMEAALARSKPNSCTTLAIQPGKLPGMTCSLTSKDITIVSGYIPPSGISLPNRQSAKPLDPVSTKSGEGQFDTTPRSSGAR